MQRHSLGRTRKCDPRCWTAKGPNCSCACGGSNHGSGRPPEGIQQLDLFNDASRPRHARYEILVDAPGVPLLIKDLGPWDQFPTITNDAEWVVRSLRARLELDADHSRRLFYLDSDGRMDELCIERGRFKCFASIDENWRAALSGHIGESVEAVFRRTYARYMLRRMRSLVRPSIKRKTL